MIKRRKTFLGSPEPITSSVIFRKHCTVEEFAAFEKLARERNIPVHKAIESVATEVSSAPIPELNPDLRRPPKRKPTPRPSSATPLRWR
jgi:hypothetical protein